MLIEPQPVKPKPVEPKPDYRAKIHKRIPMLGNDIDHLENKTIWMFWTGKNELSVTRLIALERFRQVNRDCDVRLITHDIITQLLPNMHEGYQFLSETHKSDYLRCYFLHYFGGGYADIKEPCNNWVSCFEKFQNDTSLIGCGYKELGPNHTAYLQSCNLDPQKSVYCREFSLNKDETGWCSERLKKNWYKLIGNGCYIFRKRTAFTQDWWNGLHEKMEGYYDSLKQNPASWPQDRLWRGYPGDLNPDGSGPSKYPLSWSGILGNIFHPLVLKYSDNISQDLPKFYDREKYR